MKTLSGTFAFVALAVIAIVAAIAFRAFATATPAPTPAHQKFKLGIGGPTKEDYVDVKQPDFDQAVKALAGRGGQYKIRYKRNDNTVDDPYDPDHPHDHLSIKTDKVTTSELAKNAPAEESSAYDPHAVYHVSSNSATDIKAVLDTFKEPSPTPTP